MSKLNHQNRNSQIILRLTKLEASMLQFLVTDGRRSFKGEGEYIAAADRAAAKLHAAIRAPGAQEAPEVIGRIATHPSRPDRLAVLRPDGTASNWFGLDQSLADVAALLAGKGANVTPDGDILA